MSDVPVPPPFDPSAISAENLQAKQFFESMAAADAQAAVEVFPEDYGLDDDKEVAVPYDNLPKFTTDEVPVDYTVNLIRGFYFQQTGKPTWASSVTVKSLTGADEEALAKLLVNNKLGQYVIELVARGIEFIDGEPHSLAELRALIKNLLPYETEVLTNRIIAASFGNEHAIEFKCANPNCSKHVSVTVSFSEHLDLHVPEGVDFRAQVFTAQLGKDTLSLRWTNTGDSISMPDNLSPAEADTHQLVKSIQEINGEWHPVEVVRNYVLSMRLKDRRDLLKVLNDNTPYVDPTLDIECECGFMNNHRLIPLELIFRG